MRLLHVIASAKLEGGGPIEGVRQRAKVLLQMGHFTEVVCLDTPDEVDVGALGMPVHALGPSNGSYRANPRLAPWLKLNANRFDAVTVHGIWQQHDLGTWKALRGTKPPYFVFPHGMLDPWFKKTYPLKHLKKCLYWPWQYRVLRDAAAVLFTCDEERLLARQSFWPYRVRERVVQYGTAAPIVEPEKQREAFWKAFPHLRDRPFLLFLSRIHPKKGCDLLVRAYAEVHGQQPEAPWLVFAGPDQVGWQKDLEAMARDLGVADRVVWTGMLKDDLKWGAYHACQAFVLPSHQENFGIVVAEAMACGIPVLLTKKVNIWREVQEDGAGLVEPDTLEGISQLLRRWSATPYQEREHISTNAVRSFGQRFEVRAAAQSLIDTVREVGHL